MSNRPTKIIVIEDSRSINELLTESIHDQLGLEVDSATTLQKAINLVSAQPEKYITAITDLNLPDAQNGEVVDAMLSFNVKPIILTGSLSDDIHDEMLDKPIIDYVVKRNLNEIQYIFDLVKRLKDNFDKKVLVVDDSRSSRMLIQTLLERHHLNVDTAATALDALELIKNNKKYDLIITDYNMPEMDGPEFIVQVRNKYSRNELPIIGISSTGSGTVSVQLLKSGANDFISRPFLHEEFYCRVNQNLDAASYYNELRNKS